MKKILLLLFASGITLHSCNTKLFSALKDNNVLPGKILRAVSKSDSVVAYQIDAMGVVNDSVESLCGFAVIRKPIVINENQINKLKEIIDAAQCYDMCKSVRKMSSFIPDYGFKFYSKNCPVTLLLDQHASIWGFYYKDKQYLLDNDSIQKILLPLIDDVYKCGESSSNNVEVLMENSSVAEESKEKEYIKLDSEIRRIINSAKKVTCCILDPLSDCEKGFEKLGDYVILQKKEIEDSMIIASIGQTITGNKSFEKSNVVKNCTFLPDIVFQIQNGNSTLNMLFSFYCSECEMRLGDKQVFRNDCGLIQSSIIEIARQIYPRDKYLRRISI